MSRDNKTSYLIMGMLSHEPMTGYDIKRRMELAIRYFWNAGYGQIYPTLAQLEKKGLISPKKAKSSNNRGSRMFAITNKGRTVLKKWLAAPVEGEPVRYEILLKLFFSSLIPPGKTIRALEKFLEDHEKNAEAMKAFEKNLLDHLDENIDHRYYLATVRFGARVYEAYCRWARETIDDLERLRRG